MTDTNRSKQEHFGGVEISAKGHFNSRIFLALLTMGGGVGTFGWLLDGHDNLQLRGELEKCASQGYQYETRILAWEDWAKKVQPKIPAEYVALSPPRSFIWEHNQ